MTLVTGAGGFIGEALCAGLAAAGREVLPLRRRDLELTDRPAVFAALQAAKPRTVVHLAASVTKGEGEREQVAQWRDTFEVGRALVDAAVAAHVPHVIIAGSIEELGQTNGVLPPTLPGCPVSTYGACKHLLREYVAVLARRGASTAFDWVRPFTVYGPGQTGDMLIPYAFESARSAREARFSDGEQVRDFLFVDDLVAFLVQLVIAGPSTAARVTTHHVGSGQATRVRDILTAIAGEFDGARFEFGARPRRAGEPDRQEAPPTGDPRVLHWQPRTAWRTGVSRTAAWWKARDVSTC